MLVFVSYSRQDHDLEALQGIKTRIKKIGQPYIDDLHDHRTANRLVTVHRALYAADSFVLVNSPNYLKTPWTHMEYQIAMMRGSPFIVFTSDGTIIGGSAAQWLWEHGRSPSRPGTRIWGDMPRLGRPRSGMGAGYGMPCAATCSLRGSGSRSDEARSGAAAGLATGPWPPTVDLYGHLLPEADGRTSDAPHKAFAYPFELPDRATPRL